MNILTIQVSIFLTMKFTLGETACNDAVLDNFANVLTETWSSLQWKNVQLVVLDSEPTHIFHTTLLKKASENSINLKSTFLAGNAWTR